MAMHVTVLDLRIWPKVEVRNGIIGSLLTAGSARLAEPRRGARSRRVAGAPPEICRYKVRELVDRSDSVDAGLHEES